MKTVNTKADTSLYVEVFTAVLPFIFLTIIVAIIVAIVYIVKIVNRYLANSEIAEQKLNIEKRDLQEIKQRLDRIEKILSEVE